MEDGLNGWMNERWRVHAGMHDRMGQEPDDEEKKEATRRKEQVERKEEESKELSSDEREPTFWQIDHHNIGTCTVCHRCLINHKTSSV